MSIESEKKLPAEMIRGNKKKWALEAKCNEHCNLTEMTNWSGKMTVVKRNDQLMWKKNQMERKEMTSWSEKKSLLEAKRIDQWSARKWPVEAENNVQEKWK